MYFPELLELSEGNEHQAALTFAMKLKWNWKYTFVSVSLQGSLRSCNKTETKRWIYFGVVSGLFRGLLHYHQHVCESVNKKLVLMHRIARIYVTAHSLWLLSIAPAACRCETTRMRRHTAGCGCWAVSAFLFPCKERWNETEIELFSRTVVWYKINFVSVLFKLHFRYKRGLKQITLFARYFTHVYFIWKIALYFQPLCLPCVKQRLHCIGN